MAFTSIVAGVLLVAEPEAPPQPSLHKRVIGPLKDVRSAEYVGVALDPAAATALD